jgi:hypothetical protein
MAKGLGADRVRELARSAAEQLLRELRAEIIAIERTFPELALPAKRRALGESLRTARSRTRTMSAQARAEVSKRMKKYWAERRKARSKVAPKTQKS